MLNPNFERDMKRKAVFNLVMGVFSAAVFGGIIALHIIGMINQ